MLKHGPRNLITDVSGIRVGNSTSSTLKSGVTVLTSHKPLVAAVDVRGGAPGTRETDLLAPDKLVDAVDAIILSGGSAFGLDAASGVMDELASLGRGYRVGSVQVPIVSAAILFDLLNGGEKSWTHNPYSSLGAEALRNADTTFRLGSHGAGCGANCADYKGGLGSASLVTSEGITVGALVAVNARGSVCMPGGRHFWAAPFEIGAEFGGLGPSIDTPKLSTTDSCATSTRRDNPRANTTIAIVACDADIAVPVLHRIAVAAHDGLARSIFPSHTPLDGDTVFAVCTGMIPVTDTVPSQTEIGHAASIALARAVARAVYEATPAKGDLVPCYREVD